MISFQNIPPSASSHRTAWLLWLWAISTFWRGRSRIPKCLLLQLLVTATRTWSRIAVALLLTHHFSRVWGPPQTSSTSNAKVIAKSKVFHEVILDFFLSLHESENSVYRQFFFARFLGIECFIKSGNLYMNKLLYKAHQNTDKNKTVQSGVCKFCWSGDFWLGAWENKTHFKKTAFKIYIVI